MCAYMYAHTVGVYVYIQTKRLEPNLFLRYDLLGRRTYRCIVYMCIYTCIGNIHMHM